MTQQPVVAALEQQVTCYRKLAKLAELQHVYVQKSQTEELLGLLQSRQIVLDEVADLEQVIGPVKKRWSRFLEDMPSDDRELAKTCMAESQVLLEQITAADKHDALVLQQRKLNLGRQISQTTIARNVNRTYAVAAYGKPVSRMDISQ